MDRILACKCFKIGQGTTQDAIHIFWKGQDDQGQIIIESQDIHIIDCNSFGLHGEPLVDSIDYFTLGDTLQYLGYNLIAIMPHPNPLDESDQDILDTPIRSLRNMQVTVK